MALTNDFENLYRRILSTPEVLPDEGVAVTLMSDAQYKLGDVIFVIDSWKGQEETGLFLRLSTEGFTQVVDSMIVIFNNLLVCLEVSATKGLTVSAYTVDFRSRMPDDALQGFLTILTQYMDANYPLNGAVEKQPEPNRIMQPEKTNSQIQSPVTIPVSNTYSFSCNSCNVTTHYTELLLKKDVRLEEHRAKMSESKEAARNVLNAMLEPPRALDIDGINLVRRLRDFIETPLSIGYIICPICQHKHFINNSQNDTT